MTMRILIAAAAAAFVAQALAPIAHAARGDFSSESYDTMKRGHGSQQPLWAPDLNDRNAVY